MTTTPLRDCNTLAVHKSGVGQAGFSPESRQVKPLELPVTRPEKSDRGFLLGSRLLRLHLAAREAGKVRSFLASFYNKVARNAC